jgi:hypothetical protein
VFKEVYEANKRMLAHQQNFQAMKVFELSLWFLGQISHFIDLDEQKLL